MLRAHPHVAAHFFCMQVDRFNGHLDTVLDKEWGWFRYEFQHRGSVHLHGFKRLKNDPGLVRLGTHAAKGVRAQPPKGK